MFASHILTWSRDEISSQTNVNNHAYWQFICAELNGIEGLTDAAWSSVSDRAHGPAVSRSVRHRRVSLAIPALAPSPALTDLDLTVPAATDDP
jgi:hypothetical protein